VAHLGVGASAVLIDASRDEGCATWDAAKDGSGRQPKSGCPAALFDWYERCTPGSDGTRAVIVKRP